MFLLSNEYEVLENFQFNDVNRYSQNLIKNNLDFFAVDNGVDENGMILSFNQNVYSIRHWIWLSYLIFQ